MSVHSGKEVNRNIALAETSLALRVSDKEDKTHLKLSLKFFYFNMTLIMPILPIVQVLELT